MDIKDQIFEKIKWSWEGQIEYPFKRILDNLNESVLSLKRLKNSVRKVH